AEWQEQSVSVRVTSLKTAVQSARLSGALLKATLNLASNAEQTAHFEQDFGYAFDQVQAPFAQSLSGTVLRAVLDLKKGANSVAFTYRVPEPVALSKTVDAGQWTYQLKNRLPLSFTLSFSVDDAANCPMLSPDLHTRELGHGLWRLSADVPLLPAETRTLRAFLDCPEASLENQSLMLKMPASLDAQTRLAFERANAALLEGKLDEAATLFLQIQQPPVAADPLARLSQFRDLDAATQELHNRAVLAQNRNDASGLAAAQKELENHLSDVRKSLEARAAAVCKNCPAEVSKIVKTAQSDLFLEKYAEAEAGIEAAQAAFAQHEAEEEAQADALETALVNVEDADFSVADAFLLAFEIPSTATRWRSDNTGYTQAKKAADALEKTR
ncbi:MAG: hypothetical protein Q8P02_00260, partial [Candidatus Micrarchaeota archaeon]|nr:hypothetical protein [Candidatus Micrarchaeota archaeon]